MAATSLATPRRPLPGRSGTTGHGVAGGGCQPAMVRAQACACAWSVIPGKRCRRSMMADSSPSSWKAARPVAGKHDRRQGSRRLARPPGGPRDSRREGRDRGASRPSKQVPKRRCCSPSPQEAEASNKPGRPRQPRSIPHPVDAPTPCRLSDRGLAPLRRPDRRFPSARSSKTGTGSWLKRGPRIAGAGLLTLLGPRHVRSRHEVLPDPCDDIGHGSLGRLFVQLFGRPKLCGSALIGGRHRRRCSRTGC